MESNEKLNILLTNDDGLDASGIVALGKALLTVANVYVCAPESQRSAASHSITMREPISFFEVERDYATRAFSMSGTPVDCVNMGLGFLQEHERVPIDFVYSGINIGSNLGTDTIYSGTVGAALEGAFRGKNAVAASVACRKEPEHYEYTCELAVELLDELVRQRDAEWSLPVVLNLNVPDRPKEEVKGVRITRLGYKGYHDQLVDSGSDENVNRYYFYGDPVRYDSKNTNIDVIANQEGYASITPLFYDLTAHARIEGLKHLAR